jgi:hypothetical protein
MSSRFAMTYGWRSALPCRQRRHLSPLTPRFRAGQVEILGSIHAILLYRARRRHHVMDLALADQLDRRLLWLLLLLCRNRMGRLNRAPGQRKSVQRSG